MMSRVHAFLEAFWRIGEADAAPDPRTRDQVLEQMYDQASTAMSQLTLATREVLLDGPAPVSQAAEQVRALALRQQRELRTLAGDATPERRRDYDATYRELRDAYVGFIELARNALDAEPRTRASP